ncbi:MAG: hypothetical protein RIC19_21380 [Phaeodactylibacter sp.]|uniref:hypothetical protein n=1 Tax=Phaeodactylibacter sp. TaxID=1940289 RepID=UPI0032EAF44A
MRSLALALLLSGLFGLTVAAQPIFLNNASFEDGALDATVPSGWFGCETGSTPDILPGQWGVYNPAEEGDTYLGLITREDGTWESIGQRLTAPLKKGDCYTLTLFLSHSNNYETYNGELRLRIYGGAAKCQKAQVVYESPLIRHPRWEAYEVEFFAKQDIYYLVFEAYHPHQGRAFRGNILVDAISPIEKCTRAMLD